MVSRDLLRRRRGSRAKGSTEFIFKHALIRDVAYGSLPRGERARLHIDVAGWLLDDANMPREPVDDLAIHYAEAWRLSRSMTAARAPEGLARSAALYLGRWAEETMARQALLAESLYARALEVGDEAPGEVDPELRARHAIGRAECLIELGRHQEAREAATYALQLADGLNHEQLGARALVAWDGVEFDTGDDDLASDLLGRALASFQSVGDVSGEAWATHRLSEIATKTDYTLVLEHLRRAHGLFVEAGDPWGQAMAAQDLAYMLSTIGDQEFRDRYREAKQLVEGEGERRVRERRCFARSGTTATTAENTTTPSRSCGKSATDRDHRGGSLRRGGLAADRGARRGRDAIAVVREWASATVIAFGREIHSVRVRPGRAAGARAALRSGDPRGSARRLESSRRALERWGARTEMLEADLLAAEMFLERGAWGRVREPAEAGAAAARASGERLIEPVGPLLIGRAALGAGDVTGAAASLAGAVALAREAGATGTLSVARGAYDQAVLLSGRRPRSRRSLGSGIVFEAIEAENHGLASMQADGNEEAVASFREAVELWRVLGWTVWLARALAMQGEALRRSGDPRRAAPALTQARRCWTGSRHQPGVATRSSRRSGWCETRPLAETCADRARVAVLVGHDIDPLEAGLAKQPLHRPGLVAA